MQDAARDMESDELQKPRGQEAVRQGKVDAESVALQKPETQEAVKQVQVDEESAQLQKPETHQVTQPVKSSCFPLCTMQRTYILAVLGIASTALSARTLSWPGMST